MSHEENLDPTSRATARLLPLAAAACLACGDPAPGFQEAAPTESVRDLEQALATDDRGWAWVLASGELGHGYRAYSRDIASSKILTGRYRIDVPGLGYSNRQVVAYGSSNTACQLIGGAQGGAVYVDCYAPSGDRTDSAFVVSFDQRTSASGAGAGAYLSSAAHGYAHPAYSWNSTEGTNTVTWSAARQEYTAILPGLDFHNASVHVTANSSIQRRCKVKQWFAGTVTVKCFDRHGNPAQSMFDLAYNQGTLHGARSGGHSWIPSGYPSPHYTGALASIACFEPGPFSTEDQGLPLDVTYTDPYEPPTSWVQFFPMVTAYGANSDQCKVQYWTSEGGYRTRVLCFDHAGAPVDASSTPFTLTFTDNYWPGPC